MSKQPRKLSLVKFDFDGVSKAYSDQCPFKKGKSYIFLGEIPNMPGHCVIVDAPTKVHFGYHTGDFVELSEEEV